VLRIGCLELGRFASSLGGDWRPGFLRRGFVFRRCSGKILSFTQSMIFTCKGEHDDEWSPPAGS